MAALRQHGTERVLIAYDADDAGDQGAARLAERLGKEGVECRRVRFPQGLDANAVITSVEDPAGTLAELLAGAVPIGPTPARRPAPTVVAPAAPAGQGGEEKEATDGPVGLVASPAAEPSGRSVAGFAVGGCRAWSWRARICECWSRIVAGGSVVSRS